MDRGGNNRSVTEGEEMSDITWTPVRVRLGQIRPWDKNPRMSSRRQAERLIKSERDLGQIQTLAIGPADADGLFPLYDGHQRCKAWFTVKGAEFELWAMQSNRPLREEERRQAAILVHTATGGWDWQSLSGWSAAEMNEWGMDADTLKGWKADVSALGEFLKSEQPDASDAEVDESRADELREKWQTELGQYWAIDDHRIFIGDSAFDATGVSRLFNGRKAVLVHADPPYGMGKESEGIANDNLYREKLDLFQMAWWKNSRPHLDDNGSAYIWGQADDLWRLWYCGGLRDSERLTFRNEIIWEKQGAQGIGSDAHRQYPTASERCLFFMLGEQGFNVNASNYWEGWTPIVDYLEASRQAMGWSIKDTKRIAGHSENSGCHWFDKSQWSMPTREVYEAWQSKAESSDAFKREYDELKREFYSTRAHFDNAHDNMTDVWHFPRVTGDERMGHATPKPADMMERIVKSSAPDGGLVYVPFLGTGPEMVACQNLGRICYGADVDAGYVALVLERMSTAFPALSIRKLE
jgi:DNA modification methylase